MENFYENLYYAMQQLKVGCKFKELGSLSSFSDAYGNELLTEENNFYDYIYDLLLSMCDFAQIYDLEEYGSMVLYLSDACIRRYHQLCRRHAKLTHIAVKRDPYVKLILHQTYVNFSHYCPYDCSVCISWKHHHKFGGGLAIYQFESFVDEYGLLQAVAETLLSYQNAMVSLVQEIKQLELEEFKCEKESKK